MKNSGSSILNRFHREYNPREDIQLFTQLLNSGTVGICGKKKSEPNLMLAFILRRRYT